ncbi:MAG: PAS domain S-box protein, partial [Deltaproteobacteria bacterium]|nr:PAS domain S-box protein [Deltaproteobacteria bacterium]
FVHQNFKIIFANRRLYQMLNYEKDGLIGLEHWRVYHPDFQALTRERARTRLNGGTVISPFQNKMLRNDGSSFEAEIHAWVISLRGERAVQVCVRDITERKEAETALRESEKRYRDLFNNINDMIYAHDLAGRFTMINRVGAENLGYTVEELEGKLVADLIPPKSRYIFYDEYLPALKDHGYAEGLVVYLHKNGKEHHVEFKSFLIDENGTGAYIQGSGRDVTERILAKNEMKKLEEQLIQAQKMEAIGTLAGGIAHDFNNLLQAIYGYIQLLMIKKSEADPDYDRLKRIKKATERATEMVSKLLTFSRKIESKPEPLNLNQAVKEVQRLLARTIPKMIEINLDLAEDLSPIHADPTQLEQVILNLGINAKDAMPDGGKLFFRTENILLDEKYCNANPGVVPGCYVRLSVTDTGAGMDRETVKHIFEPFFTTKAQGMGTGLGLAMVYGIVKSHSGHVVCHSEFGQGTIFDLFFPALEAAAAQPAENFKAPVNGGNEVILLVDDEEILIEIEKDMLEEFGYETRTAYNGETAIDIYRTEMDRVNLVILDLNMPGMGGERCLEELLLIDPDVKVVIASGYYTGDRIEEMLKAGAAAFIGKPYQMSELLQLIRDVLNR